MNQKTLQTRNLHREKDTIEWQRALAFTPQEVIGKTLNASAQMVESLQPETRSTMCGH